ncbi:hypothetical protein [Natronomonas sp. LN261]|uniref:hypothetical protein n=1 Tax=Natronomonas sp. LN261 TaxID=2750669 RepID=UPI0015EF99AB|nr:hypothetical protein [Natronomonas sp. LN261]
MDDDVNDYWNDWKLDPEEFNRIIDKNSNALSAIYGYVAEERLRESFLEDDERVTDLRSPADQDSADKGDWAFKWKGEPMKIEVKSLQTHTIEEVNKDQQALTDDGSEPIQYKAGFHLKGTSDQRTIIHEGNEYNTTLMNVDDTDVDIMAVNLYKIKDEWDFAFLKVEDLPRSKGSSYPDSLRQKLARSQIKLTIPLQEPFTKSLYELMDEIVAER